MAGTLKLLAVVVIVALAVLSMLMVFEVIPADVFGEGLRKILLGVTIIGLASAAIVFITRLGK